MAPPLHASWSACVAGCCTVNRLRLGGFKKNFWELMRSTVEWSKAGSRALMTSQRS